MGKSLSGRELGEGFYQRKDGLFEGRYIDRWGKRKSLYHSDMRKLKKELADAISKNRNFTSIKDEVRLDEWFDRWMEIYKERTVRANTQREYTHIYNQDISPYIGRRCINTFVKSDIQRIIDLASDRGLGYERQHKIKVILTDMFQRAIEDSLMVNNPAKGVIIRAKKVVNARALTLDEQKEFFAAAEGTFYCNFFYVAVNTGMRPGELYALQLDDVHFDEGYIDVNKTLVYQKYLSDDRKTYHVEPPKTQQSVRKVPINSKCREYLERQFELKRIVANYKPKEQNDYLFVTKYNTRMNGQILRQAIETIVNKINYDKEDDLFARFKGHTFRHTFATRCFEAGIEPKVIQNYLGHASLKMTMDLYTHVTDDKAKGDIEKIAEYSTI
jgi:integrase